MTSEATAAPEVAQGAHENVHMAPDAAQEQAPQRKKYVFKKRDPVAAAKLEEERKANMKQNPFGDAKPREAVLAQRTGKDEATVVKEDASTYAIHLKLNAAQFAEKKAKQHEIEDLKSALASGDQDPEQLQADIIKKEEELSELVKGFEKLLIEQAKSGLGARVDRTKPFDSERPEQDESYQNFSRDRGPREGGPPMRGNRGSFQPGAYEDTGERDGFGASAERDGGSKGRRGGGTVGRRDDKGWGGRDGPGFGGAAFPTQAFQTKGHSHMQTVPGVGQGAQDYRGFPQGHLHAGPAPLPYPGMSMGYSFAPPPMYAGYKMAAGSVDYQPVHER